MLMQETFRRADPADREQDPELCGRLYTRYLDTESSPWSRVEEA